VIFDYNKSKQRKNRHCRAAKKANDRRRERSQRQRKWQAAALHKLTIGVTHD